MVRGRLLATSLPLLAVLGAWDRAREHLELLDRHPGFRSFWATERAGPLRMCLADEGEIGYEILRGMPWNYA